MFNSNELYGSVDMLVPLFTPHMANPNDLPLDRKFEFFELKKISEQWENINPPMQKQMPPKFAWDKSDDYYQGLMAGFYTSLLYKVDAKPTLSEDHYIQMVKICTIIVAKHLKEKIEASEQ